MYDVELDIPEPYRSAHKQCSVHRHAVEAAEKSGCFYCYKTFDPSRIEEWIDNGTTALCPDCGIDSVLPGVVDVNFLRGMGEHWFGRASDRNELAIQSC